jgi:hypothetical protein
MTHNRGYAPDKQQKSQTSPSERLLEEGSEGADQRRNLSFNKVKVGKRSRRGLADMYAEGESALHIHLALPIIGREPHTRKLCASFQALTALDTHPNLLNGSWRIKDIEALDVLGIANRDYPCEQEPMLVSVCESFKKIQSIVPSFIRLFILDDFTSCDRNILQGNFGIFQKGFAGRSILDGESMISVGSLAIGLDHLADRMFESGKKLITNLASQDADACARIAEIADSRDIPTSIRVKFDRGEETISFIVDNGFELIVQSLQMLIRPV